MKKPNKLIEFTFDVNDVFEKIKIADFSNLTGKFCRLDYDRLITQKEVFDRLPGVQSKGFCVLVSIYNAFPDVFKSVSELVDFIKYALNNKLVYSSLEKMTLEINKLKGNNLLYSLQDLSKSYRLTCENIDNNKPVVISYTLQEQLSPIRLSQHAVTIIGYNDEYIFYKENSEDNYLFSSLAYYIMNYYKLNKVPEDNNLLMKLMSETDENNCWELLKKLFGYNVGHDGISSLKKSFLTNKEYYYDANGLIIYTKDIPVNFNCNSDNYEKFNLSKLINRINNL